MTRDNFARFSASALLPPAFSLFSTVDHILLIMVYLSFRLQRRTSEESRGARHFISRCIFPNIGWNALKTTERDEVDLAQRYQSREVE